MRKELRSLYVILLLAIPMVALAHSPAAQPQEEKKQRSEAKYRDAGRSRYSVQAVPSIHIIVKNGNVTLEGVVDNETDKNLANLRASGVPNVFSVKNNLVVASDGK